MQMNCIFFYELSNFLFEGYNKLGEPQGVAAECV